MAFPSNKRRKPPKGHGRPDLVRQEPAPAEKQEEGQIPVVSGSRNRWAEEQLKERLRLFYGITLTAVLLIIALTIGLLYFMHRVKNPTVHTETIVETQTVVETQVLVEKETVYVTEAPTVESQMVTIPNFLRLSKGAAVAFCNRNGLEYETETHVSNRPNDIIIGQEPSAGKMLKKGGTLKLSVSKVWDNSIKVSFAESPMWKDNDTNNTQTTPYTSIYFKLSTTGLTSDSEAELIICPASTPHIEQRAKNASVWYGTLYDHQFGNNNKAYDCCVWSHRYDDDLFIKYYPPAGEYEVRIYAYPDGGEELACASFTIPEEPTEPVLPTVPDIPSSDT